ncbi:very short patch repair endonuclease [Actinosynnema sp. NPDC091369]
MKGNRGKDTKPELALRALLHRAGLRYRVGIRPLRDIRRTADIVFPRVKVAVFVDGCFWHGCPEHHRPASTNSTFWQEKIRGNQLRDRETDRILADAGWEVVRVWEHENAELSAVRVSATVRSRRAQATPEQH